MRTCISLVVALILLSGCFGGTWRRTDRVVGDKGIVVEVETRASQGQSERDRYSHPGDIPSEGLRVLMEGLAYKHKSSLRGVSRDVPVVPAELVETLSRSIVTSLSKAGPADRVRFLVIDERSMFGLLPAGRRSRGVAFIRPEGVLNLAFDVVGDTLDPDEASWGDPTRRRISTAKLVLPSHAKLHKNPEGRENPLWVTARIADLKVSRYAPALEPQRVERRRDEAEPFADTTELEKTHTKQLSDREIITRLRLLEELYRERGITEELYREKREELLLNEPRDLP